MKGYYPQNVSDYTLKQCQEYLAKYPDSLKAESVKQQLYKLTNTSQSQTNQSGAVSVSSSDSSTQQKSFFVFAESIFKAVFSLLKYAVSIGVGISFWVMVFRSCGG